jgi:hypothetical protein
MGIVGGPQRKNWGKTGRKREFKENVILPLVDFGVVRILTAPSPGTTRREGLGQAPDRQTGCLADRSRKLICRLATGWFRWLFGPVAVAPCLARSRSLSSPTKLGWQVAAGKVLEKKVRVPLDLLRPPVLELALPDQGDLNGFSVRVDGWGQRLVGW